jgi:hypothetical protein
MRDAYPRPLDLPYTTPPDQSRLSNSHSSSHRHPFRARPLPLDSLEKDACFGTRIRPPPYLCGRLVFYQFTFPTFHSATHLTFSRQPYEITYIYSSVAISLLFNLP